METVNKTLALTIATYYPSLERYAMRLVRNEEAAASLVKKVLEDQYDIDGLKPSAHLRNVLLTDLRNRCIYHNQSQIFDRPPVKVPVRKYEPINAEQKMNLL